MGGRAGGVGPPPGREHPGRSGGRGGGRGVGGRSSSATAVRRWRPAQRSRLGCHEGKRWAGKTPPSAAARSAQRWGREDAHQQRHCSSPPPQPALASQDARGHGRGWGDDAPTPTRPKRGAAGCTPLPVDGPPQRRSGFVAASFSAPPCRPPPRRRRGPPHDGRVSAHRQLTAPPSRQAGGLPPRAPRRTLRRGGCGCQKKNKKNKKTDNRQEVAAAAADWRPRRAGGRSRPSPASGQRAWRGGGRATWPPQRPAAAAWASRRSEPRCVPRAREATETVLAPPTALSHLPPPPPPPPPRTPPPSGGNENKQTTQGRLLSSVGAARPRPPQAVRLVDSAPAADPTRRGPTRRGSAGDRGGAPAPLCRRGRSVALLRRPPLPPSSPPTLVPSPAPAARLPLVLLPTAAAGGGRRPTSPPPAGGARPWRGRPTHTPSPSPAAVGPTGLGGGGAGNRTPWRPPRLWWSCPWPLPWRRRRWRAAAGSRAAAAAAAVGVVVKTTGVAGAGARRRRRPPPPPALLP